MIDIIFYILLILAIIQGWRKGLILAVFSLICGLIGLAAAVKLSAVVAVHMRSGMHLTSRWVPVIAFVLVFLVVLLLIRWIGKGIEGILKLVLLEWLNKVGGILLFIFLYVAIYSICLFYGTESHLIGRVAIRNSHIYPLIAPFGPAVIRWFTGYIPYGHDMFKALEGFFDKIAHDIH